MKHYSDLDELFEDLRKTKYEVYSLKKITNYETWFENKTAGKVVEQLAMGEVLAEKNRDHELTGNWVGHCECHIRPDWLLVYRIEANVLVLTLTRTGSHSDLFGK